MNKIISGTISLTLTLSSGISLSAQTINYATSGLSTTDCNIFNPAITVQGYTHTTIAADPQYNGTSVYLPVVSSPSSNSLFGSGYAISFPFVVGHGYAIGISASATNNNSAAALPYLKVGLSTSLPSTSSLCGGWSPPYSNTAFSSIYSTLLAATNNIKVPAFLTSGQTYLLIGAYPSDYKSYLANVYVSSISISDVPPITPATDIMCSGSQLFSISTSSQVTWSTAPSGILALAASGPNNRNVTATVTGSGPVTLTASVNTPNGIVTLARQIFVGVPDYTKLNILGGPTVCANVPILFGARYNGTNCVNFSAAKITNVTWNVSPTPTQIVYNNGTSGCGGDNGSGVTIKFPSSPTQYNVRVSAQNACGTSSLSNPYVVTVQGSCGGGGRIVSGQLSAAPIVQAEVAEANFTVSPNPSSGQVTIVVPQKSNQSKDAKPSAQVNNKLGSGLSADVIKQVQVYNNFGVPVKTFSFGTGVTNRAKLNVDGIPQGLYVLVITTNKGSYKSKLEIIK